MALAHVHNINPDWENRAKLDFYRTPEIAVTRLLAVEKFRGTVWEPAAGDGAIASVLRGNGARVVGTDLVKRGAGVRGGVDFLTYAPRFKFDHIVTNPPFTHAEEFARRALEFRPKKVALLCRLLWLESKRRRELFERTPLAHVWVFAGGVITLTEHVHDATLSSTGRRLGGGRYTKEYIALGCPPPPWPGCKTILASSKEYREWRQPCAPLSKDVSSDPQSPLVVPQVVGAVRLPGLSGRLLRSMSRIACTAQRAWSRFRRSDRRPRIRMWCRRILGMKWLP